VTYSSSNWHAPNSADPWTRHRVHDGPNLDFRPGAAIDDDGSDFRLAVTRIAQPLSSGISVPASLPESAAPCAGNP